MSLKNPDTLIKVVTETTETRTKEQRYEFLNMPFGTLGASLFENMLAEKDDVANRQSKDCLIRVGAGGAIKNDNRIRTAGQFLLVPPQSLTNLKMKKYCQN